MPTTKIVKIAGVFIAVFFATYGLHYAFLQWKEIQLPYTLVNIYLFHAFFSLIICVSMLLISKLSTKYNDQLGFIYLFTMVFKVAFFCMVFYDVLFSDIVLNKIESLHLLIPIFIFLTVEVVIISKVLNYIKVK